MQPTFAQNTIVLSIFFLFCTFFYQSLVILLSSYANDETQVIFQSLVFIVWVWDCESDREREGEFLPIQRSPFIAACIRFLTVNISFLSCTQRLDFSSFVSLFFCFFFLSFCNLQKHLQLQWLLNWTGHGMIANSRGKAASVTLLIINVSVCYLVPW